MKKEVWNKRENLCDFIFENKIHISYGLNGVLYNPYVEVLTPRTSECDCIQRQGL